ncbi:hypothetical protein BV25DRAFT_164314 [Artomyces pyxidatus]|uniref:Uncharacterized protein n=1 Tax=Artomyces pyxidatus TaxID=48021 RepID=A0ACB8SH76_9AGAM|nr:hypothetical protein BV25DRAFT_164314 [Artomyces pyxidatus]
MGFRRVFLSSFFSLTLFGGAGGCNFVVWIASRIALESRERIPQHRAPRVRQINERDKVRVLAWPICVDMAMSVSYRAEQVPPARLSSPLRRAHVCVVISAPGPGHQTRCAWTRTRMGWEDPRRRRTHFELAMMRVCTPFDGRWTGTGRSLRIQGPPRVSHGPARTRVIVAQGGRAGRGAACDYRAGGPGPFVVVFVF